MTLFTPGHAPSAFLAAFHGEQVLLLCKRIGKEPQQGWLIDDSIERLMATALHLDMRRPHVRRAGREGQHIVLEGATLARAIAETKQLDYAI